jgi:adenosylcobinamide-phosphate synthase
MGVTAASAVGLALALDLAFAEFPGRVHPVALFGRVVGRFDRSWAHPTAVGVVVALALPLSAAGLAGALAALSLGVHAALGGAVAALALFATTSLRMLHTAARDVIERSDADTEGARRAVRALVGRDASALSPGELRSAAVESAAENLADGLVAPLAAFALGVQIALSVGVAAAVWVKAVNTLDSMLGYRSKPVGRASARLDDLVMWVPARLGALLLALAARSPGALVRARSWSDAPPSPNSGWPMATLAAALDVELLKPGVYDLNSGAALPDAARAVAGVRLVSLGGLLAFVLGGVVAWF